MTKALFIFVVVLLATGLRAEAYVLEGQTWPNGNIVMNLQLSPSVVPYPSGGLQDGSASWNAVAEAALAEWNQYLLHVQFTFNTNTLTPASPDNINSVFFSNTVFGQSFGSGTLGITQRYYNPQTNITTESDTVINTAFQWDSYRGDLQPNPQFTAYIFDIRRVLDHELGHNLGLNHPDLATPPQTVTAIMNSVTGNLDHIELDDISGVWTMYGQKSPAAPVIVTASPSAGGTVSGGGNLGVNTMQTLTAVAATGYSFKNWEDGSTNPSRSIVVPVGGGSYTATFASALDAWTFSSSANSGAVSGFGEVLFGDGLFRAFGNGLSTSPDGITWTAHVPSTAQTYNNNVVAYHSGVYVSVGNSPNSAAIWSSTDGFNWTDRSPAIVGNFQAVTWGDGLWVAVGTPQGTGDAALIMTSPDAIHWTLQTQGVPFAGLAGVVYANGTFVTVGTGESGSVALTSPDGVHWSATVPVSGIGTFGNVVYGNGVFLAAANYGGEATSPDGVNWTLLTPAYFTSGNVGYGNGLDLFFSNNVLATSADGLSWPYRTLADTSDVFSFAYNNGRYVATGQDGIEYSGLVSPVLHPVLPVINSSLTSNVSANLPVSYQITASNVPLAFNAVGLPAGLSVNVQTGVITGVPTVSGTFPITLFATNDAGSALATLTMTIPTAATPQNFGVWATANNVTGSMTDTPRNDGIPNLLKYLFDIDPKVPVTAAARASLPVVATASSGTQLTLTFPENKILEDVDVTVQTSTDLVNWSTPNGASINQTANLNGNGDRIMIAQVPVVGTPAHQFIRLVVAPVMP